MKTDGWTKVNRRESKIERAERTVKGMEERTESGREVERGWRKGKD